jgi:hypothetical protein
MRQGRPSRPGLGRFLLIWSLQLAAALGALWLVYFAGCQAAGQELTPVEVHEADRICSTWVHPHTVLQHGRQIPIPGHYHPRFGRCVECENAAAAVYQPRPQEALPARQPASPPQQPAQPSASTDARRELTAELAGLRGELMGLGERLSQEGRALDARIGRIETTLTTHSRAVEGLIAQTANAERNIAKVDAALERYAAGAGALAEAFEKDRAARGSGDAHGAVDPQAPGERSTWAAAVALATRAAPWLPPWVGVGLGVAGSAYGAWSWLQGRRRRAPVNHAGAREAPAPTPFSRSSSNADRESPAPSPPPARSEPPRSEHETVLQRPPEWRIRTQNEYIEKPLRDEAEAYREAIRREAKVAPQQVIGHLERVENIVDQLMGRQGTGDRPAWKQD